MDADNTDVDGPGDDGAGNEDDAVENSSAPSPPLREPCPPEAETSPQERKLSLMHQRWLQPVEEYEEPSRSQFSGPTKARSIESSEIRTAEAARDGLQHRSRSMDMRPGGRYPRNRSIDMVSPGIHLQANRGGGGGAFRLDARQGITVNLQTQNEMNQGDMMPLGRQKSQRKINISNHYTMQQEPIAEEAGASEESFNFKKSEHIKRWPSSHRQASQGDLSIQSKQSVGERPSTVQRKTSMSSMMSDISIGERDGSEQGGVARRSLISPEEIASATPNHPHPGLEYPPLYFLIKRFPFLMALSKSFFQFRWRVSYPLQKRIPLSRVLRKINVFCTIGELFLILPFFATLIICTIYSFVFPSVTISGHAARTPLIFAFATAMHNSLLTLLLGIPFERAIFYHKLSARLAYVCGLLHTFVAYFYPETSDSILEKSYPEQVQLFETSPSLITSFEGSGPNFGHFLVADSLNIGGTLIMAFMTTMVITALPYVRRKVFELFYYIHILCCIGMLGSAFYHTGFLVPLLGCLTWGIDFVIRKLIMAFCLYPRKASVRIISESVVEICFPKTSNFNYNPGQYIFLAIPKLSMFEWHPFSISSSPEQKIVTLHIRKAGSWTGALYDLAETENEISILMEGPYGSVGVDVTSDRYNMVMLFSGGIGVTPMQALCNQLMYEHSTGVRSLKKVSFVWIERDPNVMQKVDVVRRTSLHASAISLSEYSFNDEESSKGDDVEVSSTPGGGLVKPHVADEEQFQHEPHLPEPQSIASTLLALVPASRDTDEFLERQYPIEELDEEDDQDFDLQSENDQNTITTLVNTIFGRKESKVDQSKTANTTENSQNRDANFDFDDDTMCQSFLDEAYVDPENSSTSSEALDLQVYLTAKNANTINPALGALPFIHRGRPDIKGIFQKMREEAIEKKETRVAVCVCAPKVIVNMCHKACVKYSDRSVRFDFHYEVFD